MKPTLYIKVCGMREAHSLAAVAALQPDFLGFIFYPKSSRYVGQELSAASLENLPSNIKKVGVFVNETSEVIRQRVQEFKLNAVQLHGDETPNQCQELRASDLLVLKAFALGGNFDFDTLLPYVSHCDYFLFDTKGEQPGGNGLVFDWQLLRNYSLPVPYFLAGGLDLTHAETLRNLQLPGLFAVDLNSRFEISPGKKDPARLNQMIQELRQADVRSSMTSFT
ncbi:phosphoribosylanthranilate isomerase [Hymenobacter sp. BT188]|uniref:phosphoribosylanthranilate isomerase n=1 Tax=Hymenobacter sp. BT188 TaxID=2763504 RepID=UPI0016519327|nr:phosphoribosylanthranilate isomerase [Hymenobacter sp. BT188]MBC6607687.1 phosphoribosylanthranilate isomerase [Hymenobacter sp. BT188]